MRLLLPILLLVFLPFGIHAQTARTAGIAYYPAASPSPRCTLQVVSPAAASILPVFIYFHGGGLTGGEPYIPPGWQGKAFVLVLPAYRLAPQAKVTDILADAAAATAWTLAHIHQYGGDPSRVFVGGHSAGAYLASLILLDKQYLAAHQQDANRLAGLVALSGQSITHFAARAEQGLKDVQPWVDRLAPLFHARADAPPILLITGDREKELLGRYEETAFFARVLRLNGHSRTTLYELDGYSHDMVAPAVPLLEAWMHEILKAPRN